MIVTCRDFGRSPQLYYHDCSGRIPGHHKGATGRVRTGDQRLPVLCQVDQSVGRRHSWAVGSLRFQVVAAICGGFGLLSKSTWTSNCKCLLALAVSHRNQLELEAMRGRAVAPSTPLACRCRVGLLLKSQKWFLMGQWRVAVDQECLDPKLSP